MEIDKLNKLINSALMELEEYVTKYEAGKFGNSTTGTRKVLLLLKDDLINYPLLNERILRAVKDISVAAVKEYDNTPLEDAILEIGRELWNKISSYQGLEPLRMDFGRSFPI